MKQTAVEFIVKQIKKDLNLRLRGFDIDGIGKQAKEMEKEQIIEAYDKGYEEGYRDNGKFGFVYYNETYKK